MEEVQDMIIITEIQMDIVLTQGHTRLIQICLTLHLICTVLIIETVV
jgi:hypothetical protein